MCIQCQARADVAVIIGKLSWPLAISSTVPVMNNPVAGDAGSILQPSGLTFSHPLPDGHSEKSIPKPNNDRGGCITVERDVSCQNGNTEYATAAPVP